MIPNAETLKIVEKVISGNKRSDITRLNIAEEFPDDDIAQRIEKVKSILDNRQFDKSFDDDCRVVLDHIFKRKYYLYLKSDISDRKGVRTFSKTLTSLKVGGFDDVDKAKKFDRLCNDLNIELHGVQTNRSIGDKESILKDFFYCLSII
jgi:hypothetical protein